MTKAHLTSVCAWSTLPLCYLISNLISLVKRNHDSSMAFYWLAEQALPGMYNHFLVKKSAIQQTRIAAPPLFSPLLPPCIVSVWAKANELLAETNLEWREWKGDLNCTRVVLRTATTPLDTIIMRRLWVSMCKILPFGITWSNLARCFYTSTITINNLNCIVTCYSFLETSACFKAQERPYSPKYRALSHVF